MPSTPSMKEDPQEKRRRVQALVRQLKGRLIKGSDLLASNRAEAMTPSDSPDRSAQERTSLQGNSVVAGVNKPQAAANITDFYSEAKTLDGGQGRAWVLRSEIPFDGAPLRSGVYLPGDRDLLAYLDVSLAGIFNRGIDFSDLQKESLAFIDLECTGLMGGTGTYAFLVGVGFFENSHFVVEQYFMEDFPDEPAMLIPLRDRLRNFGGLVSFNGKSFDAPLLRTRFLMNRIPSPMELPHLDLLHAARRLWRGRWESCSFGTIEREIFGMRRISDVPGAMIPRIYLDYVGGINRAQMIPVIDHNVQDIVSMASLMALFCRIFKEPDSPICRHKTDQLGLSSWYRRAALAQEAICCIERAALLCRQPDEEHAISMHLANLYRRSGRWEDAADIWRERIRVGKGLARLEPCVQLAKHFEHRVRNYAEAIVWTERAFAYVEAESNLRIWKEFAKPRSGTKSDMEQDLTENQSTSELLPAKDPQSSTIADLQKRLDRLKKKQAAQQPPSNPVLERLK